MEIRLDMEMTVQEGFTLVQD